MVTRKNGESLVPQPLKQAVNNPPYPTTPPTEHPPPVPNAPTSQSQENVYSQDLNASPAFKLSTLDTAKKLREQDGPESARLDSDSGSEFDWDSGSDFEEVGKDEATKEDGKHQDESSNEKRKEKADNLPAPLKIGGASPKPKSADELPAALRVGPPEGVPKKSPEFGPASFASSTSSVALQSQNPYLRYQSPGPQPPAQQVQHPTNSQHNIHQPQHINAQAVYGGEDINSVWSDVPSQNFHPVELPSEQTPIDKISRLRLEETKTGNSLYDVGSPASSQPPLIPVLTEQQSPIDQRNNSTVSSAYEPGFDISSMDAFSSRNYGFTQSTEPEQTHRTWQEQQEWEQKERDRQARELAANHLAAQKVEQERNHEEEWHRGEAAAAAAAATTSSSERPWYTDEPMPPLPPRPEDFAPPKPPRPQVNTNSTGLSTSTEVETPRTKAQNQRKEQYQIKHIRWLDARNNTVRPAHILTQNENGPCPLLALVNALILTTPAGQDLPLVEALRTREQISLGLLLDTVVEDLLCRGHDLPDVDELYAFLLTLHTGMNVNPMFVKPLDGSNNHRSSADFHPAVRGQAQPGGFENTKEMKLYSAFRIPLIHGWLPPGESRAYAAFEHAAKTYDDANVVQFREEELNEKRARERLTSEEERLYDDFLIIKQFLEDWPTQLTEFGLRIIRDSLKPGQIVILFRNDHFSTLYKEPRSGKLHTLVTDAGYARHEEVVWETLVDIRGEGSEHFSGDFRPVGGPNSHRQSEPPIRSLLDVDDDQGWTTVQGRHNRTNNTANTNQNQGSNSHAPSPSVPANLIDTNDGVPEATRSRTEQEDHDLALALQLQEEEEDRHRRETDARRRRENALSAEYLDNHANSAQQSSGRRSPASRNNASNSTQNIRPLVPPRRPRGGGTSNPGVNRRNSDELPPPTYEQAASGRPYHPPPGHPASPSAPVRPVQQAQSAYGQMSNSYVGQGGPQGRGGRRRSGPIDQIPPGGVGRGGRRQSAVGPDRDGDKCVLM
jgi:ubiquitin carboxyl-terminal hydrolase MINDY-1/2